MNTTIRNLKIPVKPLSILQDRVIAFMILLVLTLAIFESSQVSKSISFIGSAVLDIAPFFILAIIFAAFAKASGIDQFIARAFSGNIVLSIVTASLAGALSPFCSCGVIPLIAAMLQAGVPLAPVMAFCISSPIMDPEMFIITAAGINLEFAFAKTVTAIGMGVMSGFTVWGSQKMGYLHNPLKEKKSVCCGSSAFNPHGSIKINVKFWQELNRKDIFHKELRQNGFFLGKWIILAFFLESLMLTYLPTDSIGNLVGIGNPFAIPLSAIIGIPAYLNGYAAIPLISGLMALGMTPGAALSFATAGAVSSIPAALAVYALVKRSVFFLYIVLGLMGSIFAGYLYQLLSAF